MLIAFLKMLPWSIQGSAGITADMKVTQEAKLCFKSISSQSMNRKVIAPTQLRQLSCCSAFRRLCGGPSESEQWQDWLSGEQAERHGKSSNIKCETSSRWPRGNLLSENHFRRQLREVGKPSSISLAQKACLSRTFCLLHNFSHFLTFLKSN